MHSDTEQPTRGTDVELEQRISASLRNHHVGSLRNVQVEARSGTVLLRGEVSSFYAKQLLQHSARRLAGESQVIDEVSVVTPATFRDPLRLRQSAAAGVALLTDRLESASNRPGVPAASSAVVR
jgi:osmotically-inducible protein OsmY